MSLFLHRYSSVIWQVRVAPSPVWFLNMRLFVVVVRPMPMNVFLAGQMQSEVVFFVYRAMMSMVVWGDISPVVGIVVGGVAVIATSGYRPDNTKKDDKETRYPSFCSAHPVTSSHVALFYRYFVFVRERVYIIKH